MEGELSTIMGRRCEITLIQPVDVVVICIILILACTVFPDSYLERMGRESTNKYKEGKG